MAPSREDETALLYERHADMCKVFSNATRLRVLDVLRDRELTVAALSRRLGLALGTVSPHLLLMKRRGMLVSRKQGAHVAYRLANPRMLQAFDLIRHLLYEQMRREGRLAASGLRRRAPAQP